MLHVVDSMLVEYFHQWFVFPGVFNGFYLKDASFVMSFLSSHWPSLVGPRMNQHGTSIIRKPRPAREPGRQETGFRNENDGTTHPK